MSVFHAAKKYLANLTSLKIIRKSIDFVTGSAKSALSFIKKHLAKLSSLNIIRKSLDFVTGSAKSTLSFTKKHLAKLISLHILSKSIDFVTGSAKSALSFTKKHLAKLISLHILSKSLDFVTGSAKSTLSFTKKHLAKLISLHILSKSIDFVTGSAKSTLSFTKKHLAKLISLHILSKSIDFVTGSAKSASSFTKKYLAKLTTVKKTGNGIHVNSAVITSALNHTKIYLMDATTIKKITIGIDIGTNSIKLASNYAKKKSRSDAKLLKYDFLEEGVVTDIREVNETHILTGLKTLFADMPYRRAKINVGLSTAFQNIFSLQLPQINTHELKQALYWELAPLLPGPVDNYEYDFSLLAQTEKKKINVLLAVVKKSRIEWLQKVFNSFSSSLNLLETTTLPTIDLFHRLHPKLEETVGILHLGGSNSQYTILDAAQYPEFLYLPFGGNTLNTIIAKTADLQLKEVEFLRRGMLKKSTSDQPLTVLYMENKLVEKQLKDLSLTIRKQNFRHFYNTGQKVSKIYITGGLINDPFIRSFFTHSEKIMEIPTETWDPINEYFPDLQVDPSNAYQFSTAIGLSLR